MTYTVVVSTENQDEKLLPGITANVHVVIDELHNVLKAPNAAFQFKALRKMGRP